MAARNAQRILLLWLPGQWPARISPDRHGQTLQHNPPDSTPIPLFGPATHASNWPASAMLAATALRSMMLRSMR